MGFPEDDPKQPEKKSEPKEPEKKEQTQKKETPTDKYIVKISFDDLLNSPDPEKSKTISEFGSLLSNFDKLVTSAVTKKLNMVMNEVMNEVVGNIMVIGETVVLAEKSLTVLLSDNVDPINKIKIISQNIELSVYFLRLTIDVIKIKHEKYIANPENKIPPEEILAFVRCVESAKVLSRDTLMVVLELLSEEFKIRSDKKDETSKEIAGLLVDVLYLTVSGKQSGVTPPLTSDKIINESTANRKMDGKETDNEVTYDDMPDLEDDTDDNDIPPLVDFDDMRGIKETFCSILTRDVEETEEITNQKEMSYDEYLEYREKNKKIRTLRRSRSTAFPRNDDNFMYQEVQKGVYTHEIPTLDFKSLYPSTYFPGDLPEKKDLINQKDQYIPEQEKPDQKNTELEILSQGWSTAKFDFKALYPSIIASKLLGKKRAEKQKKEAERKAKVIEKQERKDEKKAQKKQKKQVRIEKKKFREESKLIEKKRDELTTKVCVEVFVNYKLFAAAERDPTRTSPYLIKSTITGNPGNPGNIIAIESRDSFVKKIMGYIKHTNAAAVNISVSINDTKQTALSFTMTNQNVDTSNEKLEYALSYIN